MRTVELTMMDGIQYLHFGVWPGHCTVLEIDRGRKTLCLSAFDFLGGLKASLGEWPKIDWPAAYRPVGEIMRAVRFEAPRGGVVRSGLDIPLDGNEKIAYCGNGLQIMVPVLVFADAAVRTLAETRLLDIEIAEPGFQDEFLKKWARTIQDLDKPYDLIAGC